MATAGSPTVGEFAPLQGTRVLDFSKILAGPLCTQYLGDMGADVLKIEPCKGGDDTRLWPPFEGNDGAIFLAVNRNKRSLALDLKSPEGLAICERLAREADVVVESFSPGVADRLGIGYERLQALNPKLIYCSLSGYGTRGAMQHEKGYDLVLQAFCGMLSITGEADGPLVRSPFSPVDQGTGLNAVIGIMGALLQRARSGVGIKLEASLFDTAVGFLGYFLQGYWQRGTEPQRVGAGHESLVPYQVFETADRPLILGVANDTLWRAFCTVTGEPELADDPRFVTGADRVRNRAETVAKVSQMMLTRTREQWISLLQGPGIPCSPVHNLGELVQHPHTEASDMILQYRNDEGRCLNAVATPLRAAGERSQIRRNPPRLGQHTKEILSDYGFDAAQVDDLVARAIVFSAEPPTS
jgi:crotonobetainyl-CoA:carnitine CoA-transferase CaiB-like acyl-CoA transferase